MESIIRFFLLFCIAACSALYPNPNYESVVIPSAKSTVPPKPATDYGAPIKPENKALPTSRPKTPEMVYGLPLAKVPSIVYGVPTKTFDFDVTDVVEKPNQVSANPSETYGVPQPQVPSTSYGVPVQRVAVPKKTIITYAVPSIHTLDFDLGGDDGDDDEDVVIEVLKPQKPALTYGVPTARSPKPSISYGVPSTPRPVVPAKIYGVPQKSSVTYGLPKVRVPSVVYGVPERPSEQYGVPSVRIPATEYGLL